MSRSGTLALCCALLGVAAVASCRDYSTSSQGGAAGGPGDSLQGGSENYAPSAGAPVSGGALAGGGTSEVGGAAAEAGAATDVEAAGAGGAAEPPANTGMYVGTVGKIPISKPFRRLSARTRSVPGSR